MNYKKILINTFAFISLGTAAIAQAPPAAPFVTHQLKPNVYWVEGGGGNSTVIVATPELS